jgi:Uri superfamily endonuclease
MDKGIYCLVFHNPECTIGVGALGEVSFRKGWHIYIGSALGSGGLKRLGRHITLSAEKDKRPKWHVDYLLTNENFPLRYAVFATTTLRLECLLASALGGGNIVGFGCSDCACPSHLVFRESNPLPEITEVFRCLQLHPVTKTIKNSGGGNGII